MPYRLRVLAQEAGIRGLFVGLGPRMVMTAGLVSGQFLMYGAIKDGQSALDCLHERGGLTTPEFGARVLQLWARHQDWRSTKRNVDLEVEHGNETYGIHFPRTGPTREMSNNRSPAK